ncbi:hypothetical protein [Mycoplana rhizolycopersici]|uniref:Uncharacterized protein n=1 Tax=Mycoplana rhizolycopersici TaxID=2746702 RepID=A0ABX2QJE4_9HYPH|nr:hypothetical protein [Rhizobium rhizolycopersici]NVP57912.1 hypothetical protein [Rhizobium rhizolycopersici]
MTTIEGKEAVEKCFSTRNCGLLEPLAELLPPRRRAVAGCRIKSGMTEERETGRRAGSVVQVRVLLRNYRLGLPASRYVLTLRDFSPGSS